MDSIRNLWNYINLNKLNKLPLPYFIFIIYNCNNSNKRVVKIFITFKTNNYILCNYISFDIKE